MYEDDVDWIDLGSGHSYAWFYHNGVRVGLIERHPRPDGAGDCRGTVWTDGAHGDENWNIVSETRLTLTPSILCTICGNHGFVRDGKWVPA